MDVRRVISIWRWNRLTMVLAVCVLLILLGIWALARPHSDTWLEALRRQGSPTTLAELNAFYAPVLASENVGLACEQAFKLMPSNQHLDEWLRRTNSLLGQTRTLLPETKAYLEGVLGANQAGLDLLHALPKSDRSRYTLDLTQGSVTLLPHLAPLRDAVGLLVMEALLKNANGQAEPALESLRLAGRVADSLASEPILVSYLVRMAAWRQILGGLEQMLNTTPLTEAQLASLQGWLAQAEQALQPGRALVGEQAFGLGLFTDRQEQQRMFSGPGPAPGSRGNLVTSLVIGASSVSGLLRRDRTFYLDNMAAVQAAARQPFPARFTQGQVAGGNLPTNRLFILSRMLLPKWGNFFSRDAENAARLRVGQTVLAIERFRLAHGGALPERLAELAPAYLAAVPLDPIDGAPLRYKRLAPGYLVYSVGADGKDDTAAPAKTKPSTRTVDVLFEIHR